MRISARGAAVTLLVAMATLVPGSPANATNESGTRDCTGNGHIVPTVEHQPYFGYELAVKKAGPPSGPTWGVSVPNNPTGGFKYTISDAWYSPFVEGAWSAHSDDPVMSARVGCSERATPVATPAKILNLGDRSCGADRVRITADGYSDIWVSWRRTASGPRQHVKFPGPGNSDTALRLNDMHTRDSAIFDIRLTAYRSGTPGGTTPDDWFAGWGTKCE